MSRIGIAVWGLGRHACKRIIPVLSALDNIVLSGVCSRNKEKVNCISRDVNCIGWTDPSEMLGDSSVDVVYISTPIGLHAKQAIQALDAGKHVWCEKPLACNIGDVENIIKTAKKYNLTLGEGFMYLHHSQFRRVFNFINNSETGKLHSIICRFAIPYLTEPGFRYDSALGGGAFLDIGSYPLSIITELFQDQELDILYSKIDYNKKLSIDSGGRTLLRLLNGASAYLEWGLGISYKNDIEIWTEQGSLYTDKIFSKPENYITSFKVRNKNGQEEHEIGEQQEQFAEMFRYFLGLLNDYKQASHEMHRIKERALFRNKIFKYNKNTQ